MVLSLNNQQFIIEGSNWLNINEFEIMSKIDEFNFNEFIKSEYFKVDFLKKIVKENPDKSYLTPLFYSEIINIEDFKFLENHKIYTYIEHHASIEEWGDDYFDFQKLLKKFKKISENNLSSCYILNKDWYDEKSEKVKEKEYMLYDYYYLIFWVDSVEKKLYTCEWAAD